MVDPSMAALGKDIPKNIRSICLTPLLFNRETIGNEKLTQILAIVNKSE